MNLEHSFDLTESFRALCQELAALLEQEGMLVRPFSDEKLPYFELLKPEEQSQVTQRLENYLVIARLAVKTNRSLKDAEYFVKMALEYFNFKAHPEFLEQIHQPDRVIEFYSLSNTQFFRTFSYFELTSYTLEDIYCRQWVHLYERPEAVTKKLYEEILDMIQKNDPNKVVKITMPHIIRERISLERLEVHCTGMHVSPVCQDGKIVALAAVLLFTRP